MQRSPLALIVSLTACFIAIIAAYVVLSLNGLGNETGNLIAASVSLLGILGLGAHFTSETSAQNQVIGQIQKQTNGVLDQRIKDGASAALTEFALTHGLPIAGLPGTLAAAVADIPTTPAPASNVTPLHTV